MNKEKASDKVFEYIEEKIVKGIWKEGDKIESENQLAKELNVSRVSVREAISKMVAMGILLKKKGGGSFVKAKRPYPST
ncbi:MAG: FadR/GntR family transcriptional regulator [Fusobacteriaceae bacterium]